VLLAAGVPLVQRWWEPHLDWSSIASDAELPSIRLLFEIPLGDIPQSITASPDGSYFAGYTDVGGRLTVWDATGRIVREVARRNPSWPTAPIFISNGTRVVFTDSSTPDAAFSVLDILSGQIDPIKLAPAPEEGPAANTATGFATPSDGSLLAISFARAPLAPVFVLRSEDFTQLHVLPDSQPKSKGRPSWVSFASDGRRLAYLRDDIQIVDTRGGQIVQHIAYGTGLRTLALNADGSMVADSGGARGLRVFHVSDGTELGVHPSLGFVSDLAWDAKGRFVVFVGDRDVLHIWNPSRPGTSERTMQLRSIHRGAVFTADWRRMLVANGPYISVFAIDP